MSFNDALQSVFNNYANFNGRARRKEWWYFFVIFSLGWAAVSAPPGLPEYFAPLYLAILILPMMSVSVRRLHDIGMKGWFLLWGIIPIIGWIILALKLAQEGDSGKNEFGKNPKGFKGKKIGD